MGRKGRYKEEKLKKKKQRELQLDIFKIFSVIHAIN
jgi:hypothetical protein